MEKQIITFNKKPIPISAEYRPMYQIALIAMILKYCCKSNTSCLLKIHLFSWCLHSEQNMSVLKNYLVNDCKTDFPYWTIDPTINRALLYAKADKICIFTNSSNYKLTEKGLDLVKEIESDKSLFMKEKEFLNFIGKRVSEQKVNNMITKQIMPC